MSTCMTDQHFGWNWRPLIIWMTVIKNFIEFFHLHHHEFVCKKIPHLSLWKSCFPPAWLFDHWLHCGLTARGFWVQSYACSACAWVGSLRVLQLLTIQRQARLGLVTLNYPYMVWMWVCGPCDELTTCRGHNPALCPTSAGIGSGPMLPFMDNVSSDRQWVDGSNCQDFDTTVVSVMQPSSPTARRRRCQNIQHGTGMTGDMRLGVLKSLNTM